MTQNPPLGLHSLENIIWSLPNISGALNNPFTVNYLFGEANIA